MPKTSLLPTRPIPARPRPLGDQVLVLLRPEVQGAVARQRLLFPPAAALAVLGLALSIVDPGFWPILATIAGLVVAAVANPWRLPRQPSEESGFCYVKNQYKVRSTVLRARLRALKDMPQVPGHHWDAREHDVETIRRDRRYRDRYYWDDDRELYFEHEDHEGYRFRSSTAKQLVLRLVRDSDGQIVLVQPLGEADDLNRSNRDLAVRILGIGVTAVEFFKATDAFTRPAVLPGDRDGERMEVKALDVDHYKVDGTEIVRSPGLGHISHETSVVCWGPWRDAYQRHQLAIASRKEQAETEAQSVLDKKEVERRRAHLERIEAEAVQLRALEAS